MDEDLILQEIVKSLAFEIEAVNQDNTLKWTTTDGTPLNVKVRVRNKDEPRLIQRGAIPVPRIGITAPEKLRLISSDQTILSFNVYLEGGLQKDPSGGLKKFNIGSCLGTYSDDEGPYLPGSSEQSAVESDSCSKPGSEVLKKNGSPVLNSTNTIPRNQKTFFGKCKPGGCLDPPFDEENYAYSISNSDRKENIQLEVTQLVDNTKTCEPGGCLDPPFSEDKYPYTNVRVKQQEKQELKSRSTKDKKQALCKKSSEECIQPKEKKTLNNQENPKNLTGIHARISKEDSIITYPTDVSSNETLYDQNTNKKLSIKSSDDEAQKQSYDYPVSYFVPPKDVTRNKDDERRYRKRPSSDTINRDSKGTVHDEANKSKSIGHVYMPNNALRSKDIHEENLETKCTDDVASKSYNTNKKDVAATKQENADPDLVMGTPSDVLTDVHDEANKSKSVGHDYMPNNALRSKDTHEENLETKSTDEVASKSYNTNKKDVAATKQENPDTDLVMGTPSDVLTDVHDETNKSKSIGHVYMPNNALRSKDIHEENLETKCTDDVASKSYNTNKKDVAATKQENPDPDLVMGTPSDVLTDVHDEANKSESVGHDYMPNNSLRSKDTHEENLETKSTDEVTSKSYNTYKKDVAATEQENPDTDLVMGTPSDVLTDVHDETNKSKSDGHDYMPNNALRSKDTHEENLETKSTDKVASKSYNTNKKDVAATKQENPDTDLVMGTPSDVLTDVHDETNKSKSVGYDYMPNNALRSKDTHEENLEIKCTDDVASKSYNTNKKDVAATKQENLDPDLIMGTPSDVLKDGSHKNLPSAAVYKERASNDLKPTESNSNYEIQNFKSQPQTVDSDKSHHVKPKSQEENIKIKDWQTRRDAPNAKGADKERNDKLPQFEAIYIKSTQPEARLDDQREHDTDTIKQLRPRQENSKFLKTQSPINGNSKSNLSCDNDDGISKKILVAEATKPVLATTTPVLVTAPPVLATTTAVLSTTTLDLPEKQSIRYKDKPNIGLDSSMVEKDKTSISKMCSEDFIKTSKQNLQREHEEFKNVSPQRISSSENNEFDVSSEHSIDSNHELSNTVDSRKPDDTLGHKNKQDLLAENLNSKSIDNVIISRSTLKDYIKVEPGSQTKRTSEILQKKPFTAKHNLDIEQDDINKTAPLKRKTFTVISSNTSIQKSEEIEELPENTTDVYYKTTDKSQLGSPDSTENSKNNSDTNNKNPEGKISPHQKSVPGNRYDLYLNVTDDTIPTTTSEKTKEIDSTLHTNLNENQSRFLLKNYTNINPTNNQTKPLDSIPNENRTSTDPLPIYVSDIQSNIVDDRESVLTVQNRFKTERLEEIYQDLENTNTNYKDIESLHNPEIIQDLNIINDEAKKLGLSNQLMEKVNKFSKDSLQNSYYDKSLDAKVSDSYKSTMNRKPEYVNVGKRESEKMLNIDSNKIPNQYTDYMPSKTVTDGKLDAASIRELLPNNTKDLYTKINTDYKSASFTEKHEEQEFEGTKDIEKKHSSTSGDNPAIDISQKPLSNNAHSDYSVDSASDYKYSNFNATQFVEPVFVQNDDYAVMTNKSIDKTDRNDLDYEKLDEAKNPSFISNIAPEYVEYLQEQTAEDLNYADIDQRYDNSEFLDARRNENPMQSEFTENISESPSFKNSQDVEDRNYELINETESFTKYSSHSGGYSDLISGVLSNISENKDEEENDTVQNNFLERTIQRDENILQFDAKASHDQEAINDKFESISKHSESSYKLLNAIKSSVSTLKEINRHTNKETKPEVRKNITPSSNKLKQRSDTYETDIAKLNISRDGVFIDDETGIIDQPSEYRSFQTPASIHDLIGLNRNNSRAKPVSHTGSSTLYKQPNLTEFKVEEKSNIIATESTSLRDKGPLYLDMSFCSYVNDNKQRIVQTQSPLIKPQNPIDGTVTIVKTLIRHGHEIRIPVDNDNDITLSILDKDLKVITRNSNVGLAMSQNRREKQFGDRAKKQKDILNKNLSLIYESELIPLHTVIKDLTQEVNKLATKQETLQMRMRNIKRSNSLRLIPVVKRCGCRRI